ncbi:MAG TPA: N-acetylmuramoyl-L-alanine amidase [Terriglobales bacterium]
MPSNSAAGRWLSILVLVLASVLLVSGAPDDRQLSVFSNLANYSVSVEMRNGADYIGLLETLEPLGGVSAKINGHHWKLRFNTVEAEFTDGKKRAKIQGSDFDLPSNFFLENARGIVPVASLPSLLPRLLGGPVAFHDAGRRLFIGDAAVHFTAQIFKSNPPALILNFTAPVNPTIATEPGQLSMKFTKDGVVGPGSPTILFDSKVIPSATFQESNGTAELVISATAPLMASFSNGNRTITVAAPPVANAAPAAATPPPASPSVTPSGPLSTPPPTPAATPTEPRRYFAVIDPAHGGDDSGATLGNQLLEKDITLALARRLRAELAARHLTSILVRDGDISLSLDQRANIANTVHATVYLCIHASTQGTGVRVFSSAIPRTAADRGPFIDWDAAQASLLLSSQRTVTKLSDALEPLKIPIRTAPAPLRPLNNIRITAVAVEVASPDSNAGPESPSYQESVTKMLAAGLAAVHDELEAAK